MFHMWKLEKRLPQHQTLQKMMNNEHMRIRIFIFLFKSLNGLDSIEMFEFECEAANFGGEAKGKLRKNLHFSNEIDANIAILDTIETG